MQNEKCKAKNENIKAQAIKPGIQAVKIVLGRFVFNIEFYC